MTADALPDRMAVDRMHKCADLLAADYTIIDLSPKEHVYFGLIRFEAWKYDNMAVLLR